MLSWIFRHRERLACLYGAPGARARPRELEPAPGTLAPGHLARRARWVLLVPMPPRALPPPVRMRRTG